MRGGPPGPGHWFVSLRVADLGWARRLVLGLGPDVTVVAPAELVAVVGGEARAAMDAYAASYPASGQGLH